MSQCVGCGFCCIKTPCDVARRIYGPISECPKLRWNGERYVCELVELPGQLGEDYRKELHIGAGCCAGLNSWRGDEPFDSTALTCAVYRPFLRHAGGWNAKLLIRCSYNKRIVIVRITDAMPSHYAKTGRMLDLSKAAAESLGMVRTGVFPVEVWLYQKAGR